jgi:hypothetical protein
MDNQDGIVLLSMEMNVAEIILLLQIKMHISVLLMIMSIAIKILVNCAILLNKTGAI